MVETAQLERPREATLKQGPVAEPKGSGRVVSLDVLRGTGMALMLNEATHLHAVARSFPNSWFWSVIAINTDHVPWQGFPKMLGHAAWRALLLMALGIFLRSQRSSQTYFTFEDTLTQIGLGYVPLFLLGFTRVRTQIIATVLILICFWGAFALYPAPGPNFDYARVGVPPDWQHNYTGFLSHWNKNSNLSWAFDVWFLNLFPREHPFVFNEGGWSTLSFIPTLATMILGLLTGEWLNSEKSTGEKLRGLVIGGAVLLMLGLVWQWAGLCPIVKRVWTSSYTLYSGGWVVLMLAGFYALTEWKGWRRWALPLIVVGMNSIAIYVMSWTMEPFFFSALHIHLGPLISAVVSPTFQPVVYGLGIMLIFWLTLFWMYRRKIFLRI